MVWTIMFNSKKEYKRCRTLLVTSPKATGTEIGKTGVWEQAVTSQPLHLTALPHGVFCDQIVTVKGNIIVWCCYSNLATPRKSPSIYFCTAYSNQQ